MNVEHLAKLLTFSLILPTSTAFAVDLLIETLPWLTIIVSIFAIPLASVLVTRASLGELNRIINEVAPVEPASIEPARGEDAVESLSVDGLR